MTTYITIIRAILRDNDFAANEWDVLAEMKSRMGGSIDDLIMLSFIKVCIAAATALHLYACKQMRNAKP